MNNRFGSVSLLMSFNRNRNFAVKMIPCFIVVLISLPLSVIVEFSRYSWNVSRFIHEMGNESAVE
jgi:hypothetical protein